MIFNPNFTPIIPIADNKENRTFTIRILKTLEEGGLEKAKEELGNKKKSEQLLIYIMRDEGFNQMDNGNGDLALQILELNAFAHPTSAESIQWLGEGYMETGNKELALKYFKESLSLNADNRWVNDRIKELEEVK
jgi:tetratricopeptide (TPR) repeat protein